MERYVMDTSFFLDLWKEDAAFSKKTFVGIWDALQTSITSAAIVAPKSVRDELRGTKDRGLQEWVTDHSYMFIPFDQTQLISVTEIVRRFPGYATEPKNLADPQVVALARVRGLEVLTSEKWVPTLSESNPKMPNVCEAFGIASHSIKGFCESEGIQLVQAPASRS
jgi:hypothetical protein